MQPDGTQRRRAGEEGGPSWPPDGREFLINTFDEHPVSTVMNIEKMTRAGLPLPGYQISAWPSWAGPGRLVAAFSATGRKKTRPSPCSM